MTRYAIDALVAVELARDGVVVPDEHQLVGPVLLRSHVLGYLYRAVRAGVLDEAEGRRLLDGVTTTRMRLLGDRVSRATAWRIAAELGWNDTADAEYLAVAQLQADAFVTLDPVLRAAADGRVPLADVEDLYPPS